MLPPTKTEQKDLLNTQLNTQNEENKSKYSVTNEQLPLSPFRLVGNTEQGYTITLREYMLTERKPTKEEAIALIPETDWKFMINTLTAIMNIYQDILKNETKSQTTNQEK